MFFSETFRKFRKDSPIIWFILTFYVRLPGRIPFNRAKLPKMTSLTYKPYIKTMKSSDWSANVSETRNASKGFGNNNPWWKLRVAVAKCGRTWSEAPNEVGEMKPWKITGKFKVRPSGAARGVKLVKFYPSPILGARFWSKLSRTATFQRWHSMEINSLQTLTGPQWHCVCKGHF